MFFYSLFKLSWSSLTKVRTKSKSSGLNLVPTRYNFKPEASNRPTFSCAGKSLCKKIPFSNIPTGSHIVIHPLCWQLSKNPTWRVRKSFREKVLRQQAQWPAKFSGPSVIIIGADINADYGPRLLLPKILTDDGKSLTELPFWKTIVLTWWEAFHVRSIIAKLDGIPPSFPSGGRFKFISLPGLVNLLKIPLMNSITFAVDCNHCKCYLSPVERFLWRTNRARKILYPTLCTFPVFPTVFLECEETTKTICINFVEIFTIIAIVCLRLSGGIKTTDFG